MPELSILHSALSEIVSLVDILLSYSVKKSTRIISTHIISSSPDQGLIKVVIQYNTIQYNTIQYKVVMVDKTEEKQTKPNRGEEVMKLSEELKEEVLQK